MRVLLYTDGIDLVEKSGVGRAIRHQLQELENSGISYTTNKKEYYDIVHLNMVLPNSYFMGLEAKMKGKTVIYHAHSTKEDFKNSFCFSNLAAPLFKVWLMQCYGLADLILTPTEYSKNILKSYGLKKPIVAISNGIDLEFYKKDKKAGIDFRTKYGFTENDKVIMSAGLYIERKGIIEFVELAKKMPQYQFIWFGATNLNTVPEKVRSAVNTKLPNLTFAGYVSKEEMKSAYSGCDLFLFMTHEETEGIVLLEALSIKIPVLVRDIPIYSIFQDGNTLYKASCMKEFENKISGILEKEYPDLTEKGYELAKERDVHKVGIQLIEQYEYAMELGAKTKKKGILFSH